jgi:hypothetical protein
MHLPAGLQLNSSEPTSMNDAKNLGQSYLSEINVSRIQSRWGADSGLVNNRKLELLR